MKIRDLFLVILLLIISLVLMLIYNNYGEIKILLSVIAIGSLYAISLRQIKANNSSSLLSDGRFYFVSFFTVYSVWVPLMSVFANIKEGHFSSLKIKGALTYGVDAMLMTSMTSILMLLGINLGIFLVNRIKAKNPHGYKVRRYVNNTKMCINWFWVAAISTYIYLLPFLTGGFSILRAGGSILDIEQTATLLSGNLFLTAVGFIFSSETMTISTAAFTMYLINSDVSIRKKILICTIILFFHGVLAIYTTRTARFVIILICLLASIMGNQDLRNNKYVKGLVRLVPLFLVMIYFLDYIIVNQVRANFLASGESLIVELMRRFDGVGPYDALFRAVNSAPDISMFSNVIFSFFRPIPIFGEYVLEFLGIGLATGPLYNWMASQYFAIYASGGGLAYMPQIEAYLTLGFTGCFVFGTLYGLMFGVKRKGLANLIVIAMSLMLARGSMGVIATLSISYIGICYLLFEVFLFRIRVVKRNSLLRPIYVGEKGE